MRSSDCTAARPFFCRSCLLQPYVATLRAGLPRCSWGRESKDEGVACRCGARDATRIHTSDHFHAKRGCRPLSELRSGYIDQSVHRGTGILDLKAASTGKRKAVRRCAERSVYESGCLPGTIQGNRGEHAGPEDRGATDAIVRITTTNICGSDLHMYEGRTPDEIEPGMLGIGGQGLTTEDVRQAQGTS